MESLLLAYLVCLALLILLLTSIGVRAFLKWRTPGALILGLLMTAMAIWAEFYLLEIVHPSPAVKIVARKILYLGMTLAPPFWFGFALRYTGIGTWWSQWERVSLLTLPGWIAFLLGLTNEKHHLIWASLVVPDQNPAPLIISYGPGFWLYMGFAYVLILLGISAYIIAYFKNGKVFRLKSGIVLAGVMLTGAVNIFFLLFEHDLPVDPTPLSFALSAPLIALGFFRFGVSSLFPLAASFVVDNLQDIVIVVNGENEITDINIAGKKFLGINAIKDGIQIFSVLPQADQFKPIWDAPSNQIKLEMKFGDEPKWYEARVFPIITQGENLLGRVIVLHDITTEQALLRAEKRRSQQLSLLEQTGRLIADSFDEREILQRALDTITQQFGYPETAISLLTRDNMLEAIAISGTEDFGYRPGFRQKLGEGIIGYTANLGKTYISTNVSEDRHYFSTSTKSGSAICTPIFKRGKLYGVLYVESFELNAFDELDVITMETLASQISESLQRAELYAQTRNDLRTLRTIQDISKLIASSLDLEVISQTVVKNLKDVFGYSHVSIYTHEGEYLFLSAEVGYSEEKAIKKMHISQGVIGKTYRTRSIQFIEDTAKDDTYLMADDHITSEIGIPLLKDEVVLGVLNVESSKLNQLTQADVDLLTTIAGPIAVAMDNARLHAELKRMATTDAVTGLSNRHVFEQAIHAEVERAKRNQSPMSLLVFDIDFFKQYNDKWGHPAGDARLKAVADIIKFNLRKYDIAARYGGDEFAIILTDCNQQNALAFAERLRQGAMVGAPQPPEAGKGLSGYTLSIGIATYPQDAVLPSDLLIAADNAALRSKQQGRNRIRFANDHETT